MRYQVTHQLRHDGSPEALDVLTDQIVEALNRLGSVEDVDLVADGSGAVEVTMVVEAEDQPSAFHKGWADLRTALHEVGVGTTGWERALNANIQGSVRLLDDHELSTA